MLVLRWIFHLERGLRCLEGELGRLDAGADGSSGPQVVVNDNRCDRCQEGRGLEQLSATAAECVGLAGRLKHASRTVFPVSSIDRGIRRSDSRS
jgi:hypothetical protein